MFSDWRPAADLNTGSAKSGLTDTIGAMAVTLSSRPAFVGWSVIYTLQQVRPPSPLWSYKSKNSLDWYASATRYKTTRLLYTDCVTLPGNPSCVLIWNIILHHNNLNRASFITHILGMNSTEVYRILIFLPYIVLSQ